MTGRERQVGLQCLVDRVFQRTHLKAIPSDVSIATDDERRRDSGDTEISDGLTRFITDGPGNTELRGERVDLLQIKRRFTGQGDETNITISIRIMDLNQIRRMRRARPSPSRKDFQDNNFAGEVI